MKKPSNILILISVVLTGCAHYQPQPLQPAQTARQFDRRRLDDPGLKTFVATNCPGRYASWPPAKWDLNSLTLAAFYFHPDLAVARAQWRVAAAGITTAAGRPNPVISGGPGYNFTTAAPTPWMPFGAVDLPIETAGKRGKRIAMAAAGAEAARWNFIAAAWQLRSGVRNTLIDYRAAQRRRQWLQKQVAAQRDIVRFLQGGLDAGEVSRPELVAAQLALDKAQLESAAAATKFSEAVSRLAEALGVPQTALADMNLNQGVLTIPPHALQAAAARRAALIGRADIRAALADYAASEENLRLEIAKQYPDVHFNPGYQYDQGNNKWTLGLALELPVLNQNQGPIAEAEANRKLAAARFLQLQSRVAAQVDRAVAGWRDAQAQLKTSQDIVAAAEKQVQSVTAQMQAGAASRADLALTRIELVTAQLAQLDNQAATQVALAALEDALQQPADHFEMNALLSLPARQTHSP